MFCGQKQWHAAAAGFLLGLGFFLHYINLCSMRVIFRKTSEFSYYSLP